MEPRKKKKPGQTDPGFQEEKPNKLLLLGLPAAAFVQKIFIFFHVETIPPRLFLTPESCGSAACPPCYLGRDFLQSLDNQTFKQGPRAFFEPAIGAQIPVDVFGVRDNR
jgi:hypothetical protein